MLGPHLDVSSSAVTGRHSKNQWYQHRFISWKQDFEEGLPPPYHCLGITTMAGICPRGTPKKSASFEQLTKISIFKHMDFCFRVGFGHLLPSTCHRDSVFVW